MHENHSTPKVSATPSDSWPWTILQKLCSSLFNHSQASCCHLLFDSLRVGIAAHGDINACNFHGTLDPLWNISTWELHTNKSYLSGMQMLLRKPEVVRTFMQQVMLIPLCHSIESLKTVKVLNLFIVELFSVFLTPACYRDVELQHIHSHSQLAVAIFFLAMESRRQFTCFFKKVCTNLCMQFHTTCEHQIWELGMDYLMLFHTVPPRSRSHQVGCQESKPLGNVLLVTLTSHKMVCTFTFISSSPLFSKRMCGLAYSSWTGDRHLVTYSGNWPSNMDLCKFRLSCTATIPQFRTGPYQEDHGHYKFEVIL